MNRQHKDLLKEFSEFAHLQDSSDAEIPNYRVSVGLKYVIPECRPKCVDELEDLHWDLIEDLSLVSPELLCYLLLTAKEFWENK